VLIELVNDFFGSHGGHREANWLTAARDERRQTGRWPTGKSRM
jgi:hypothetical protein